MKQFLFLLLGAMLCMLGCTFNKGTGAHQDLTDFADSLFQSSVDSAFIAGASVLMYRDGEILLDRSYGFANLEWQLDMTADASFEIGSVTKQFTAAAILRLLEAGKLSLEDDLNSYVQLDTKGRKVNIASLLNHTSGIPSYTELPEFGGIMTAAHERDTLLRVMEQHDFLFEPGHALIYNNSAYFILGLIIEKVSGMSYEDYLEQEFFVTLGLENTYYSSHTEIRSHRASGYDYRDSLVCKQYIDYRWPYAAGSLSSTTRDLLGWMQALHGGKVLSEESYQLMTVPEKLQDGSALRYAMGLANFFNAGHHEISHGGGIPGFLSDARYYPDEDLYLICLVNSTGPHGASFFLDELTWHVLDKEEPAPVELDMDPRSLTGTYSGQVRGREMSLEITGLADGLLMSASEEEEADTLQYAGSGSWRNGNTLWHFTEDQVHMDQVYGHFILEAKK